MEQTAKKNGFIYVATLHKQYVEAAKNSAFSLKENFPEAHITLFTNKSVVDVECYEIFDNVVTDNVPEDVRGKLWALSRTPYDTTMYIDSDTIINSSEISTCFDVLGDNDIMFTLIRPYNSNLVGFLDDPDFKYHGGVFVYNRKCIRFMKEWWDRWVRGAREWNYPYPNRMKKWDQFYLFYLTKHTNHGLKIGVFPNDARWNYVLGYVKEELGDTEPIITHYTIRTKRHPDWDHPLAN